MSNKITKETIVDLVVSGTSLGKEEALKGVNDYISLIKEMFYKYGEVTIAPGILRIFAVVKTPRPVNDIRRGIPMMLGERVSFSYSHWTSQLSRPKNKFFPNGTDERFYYKPLLLQARIRKIGGSGVNAERISRIFISVFREVMMQNKPIELRGLLSIKHVWRNARNTRNPMTGESVFVDGRYVPSIKMLSEVTKEFNRIYGEMNGK